MLLMMLIMSLPILGIALFFLLPLSAAIPAYLAVAGLSGLYQWLMMGAMRLPSRMGREKMIGSVAVVKSWERDTGQVIHDGEIWQAETKGRQDLARGDEVRITRVKGLSLRVRPVDCPTTKGVSARGRPHPAPSALQSRAQ